MRIFKYVYFLIMFCTMITGVVLFFSSMQYGTLQYNDLQLVGAFLMLTGSGVCVGIFVGDIGHE